MTNAFGVARAMRTPTLYGASELGVLSLTAPGDAHPRVEHLGGELFAGLSIDGAAVSENDAATWSEPFAEAVATAITSVGELSPADDRPMRIADESQTVALLLEPARVPADALPGRPLLFALDRTHALLVGSDDERAVVQVLETAERLYEADAALVSIHPLVLEDATWSPFDWRERFPELRDRIDRAIRLFGVRAYEAQTEALQRDDVHVAPPRLHVREDGVTVTFAAWPKGTATLLPVVDNVMIADPSGKVTVATLNEFLDAGGDRIVRTGLSPARYFVPGDRPVDAS